MSSLASFESHVRRRPTTPTRRCFSSLDRLRSAYSVELDERGAGDPCFAGLRDATTSPAPVIMVSNSFFYFFYDAAYDEQ
jgi:hypothetical protein